MSFRCVAGAMLVLAVVAARSPGRAQEAASAPTARLVALLPADNMTGRILDATPIDAALRAALAARDVPVLEDEKLHALMDAHRVRYTGGLAPDLAAAFRNEAAVSAVLITSVERWDVSAAPVLGLTTRLVSTDERPRILWIDGAGATGEDKPGFLDLGVVTDSDTLLAETVGRLADSLAASLQAGRDLKTQGAQRRFRPRKEFRHPDGPLPAVPARIAVLPFTSRSPRRHAGDILALHFVHQLVDRGEVEMVEPGVVRDVLLRMRLIPEGGIPYSQTELLRELLGVDLVLTGEVLDYIDSLGSEQTPVVDFMIQLLDPGRRSVVWTSFHHNTGTDRVWFFERGKVRTAAALGSMMAQSTVDRMLREPLTPVPSRAR